MVFVVLGNNVIISKSHVLNIHTCITAELCARSEDLSQVRECLLLGEALVDGLEAEHVMRCGLTPQHDQRRLKREEVQHVSSVLTQDNKESPAKCVCSCVCVFNR